MAKYYLFLKKIPIIVFGNDHGFFYDFADNFIWLWYIWKLVIIEIQDLDLELALIAKKNAKICAQLKYIMIFQK